MSALWALTGALDPRRVQDAKTTDVVNDDSKNARVTVHGTINNAPFTITRTKTLYKGSLVFQVNGVDMTTQSVKETQVLIEEQLGISPQILSRTIFHGQHSQNELLEATDAKLKEELSVVVPLGLWQEGATMARAKSRDASKKAAELTGMINLRTGDVQKLTNRMAAANEVVQAKQKDLDALQRLLNDEETRIGGAQGQAQSSDADFVSREIALDEATSKLKEAESKYQIMLRQREDELGPLQRSCKELSHSLLSLTQRCQTSERELFAASMQVETIKEKVDHLQNKWGVDLSSGLPAGFVLPDTCPTCQQQISKDGHGHSHIDLQRFAEKDIEQALQDLKDARADQEGVAAKLSLANEALYCREKTVKEMKEDLDMASARWDTEQLKMEQDIVVHRQDHSLRSEELSAVARHAQRLAHFNTLQGRINSETATASYAKATYISVKDEVQEGRLMLDQLMAQMESENFRSRTMSELGELFGQRGVQTFVLQNIVDSLNGITQAYLDELSDGTQRLDLSLDSGDRISRTAFVRGGDGNFKARPLSTLSGGQWRRCSLALSFAFAELVARRGKLRPSLCVLDEPLTHLDRSGRTKVGQLIRKMLHQGEPSGVGLGSLGMSTVILILQDLSAEELEESFDCIDEVVRDGGTSFVRVDVP
jgi:DNA repair exonuclease SbcCD ATPase subunit